MRNVILIHGYNGIPKIYKYFEYELNKKGYNIIIPNFPTKTDITINSYFEVFDNCKKYFTEDCIVIAHSIGNEIFVKYICKNNLKIGLYISLAGFGTPFVTKGREDLNSVIAPIEVKKEEQIRSKVLINKSYSIYSDNDHIVPFKYLEKFPKLIGAEPILIEGIGHMGKKSGLETLPQVIDIINRTENNSKLLYGKIEELMIDKNKANLGKTFKTIITDIKNDISQTQLEIMLNANYNLVNLYYRIGKTISENFNWGNKLIDKLALELKITFPNIKHFSVRNLKYMKSFYEEYKYEDEFVHLGAQLPWKHNLELIKRIKDKNIRKWYMEKCLEEGWSKNVLIYQLDTDLYQRQVKNIKHNNFGLTLKKNSDLANNMMKEPYIFDLIELTEDYKEKELENKMLEKLKNVLLELGSGFSFVGNQYKIAVDNQEFYIDLLFYHIKLKCYVAVELKVTEFKPEFGSKMSFYLTAIDEQIKDESDNPSIGIILCQSKSEKIVDYTLKYINRPVGVSDYKIFNKLTKDILKELPKKEDIIIHLEEEEED